LLFCKLSEDDSSEPVTSSLIVPPSWLGGVVILMPLMGMLLLTIHVLSYEGFGYIHSSVAALAYLCSFSFLLPTHTMPLLPNVC
jgi:hypothetical protein